MRLQSVRPCCAVCAVAAPTALHGTRSPPQVEDPLVGRGHERGRCANRPTNTVRCVVLPPLCSVCCFLPAHCLTIVWWYCFVMSFAWLGRRFLRWLLLVLGCRTIPDYRCIYVPSVPFSRFKNLNGIHVSLHTNV